MPVLAQGNTANLTLGAHDSITLQNRAGQSASLTVAGTLVNGQHSGTRTYGPYANGGAVVLVATAGDVYYEVGDGAYAGVSNALVQVDTTGRPIRTVTADGQVVGGGVLAKRQYLTKSAPHGRLATAANAANRTDHYQTVLETAPALMRIGILNNTSNALSNVRAAIAPANALGADNSAVSIDPTAAGGAWQNCTFSGSLDGTIAAGNTQNTIDNPNVTWTDWMNCAGLDALDGGLPVVHVRVEVPSANGTVPVYNWTDTGGWETPSNVAGRPWRMRTQSAVLGVTTKGDFTSTAYAGQCIPILIQYIPRNNVAGFTLAMIGDSTTEGTGATVRNYGAFQRAQALVSSRQRPVELCSLAINGAAASRFYLRANALLPQVKPQVCAYQIYTVNSANTPMTAADITGMRFNLSLSKTVMSENDILPVWMTGLPTNPAAKDFNGSDSLRRDYNASHVDAASGKSLVLDVAAVFSGLLDADGQTLVADGLTTDNTHPNDAGYSAIAVPVSDLMRRLQALA